MAAESNSVPLANLKSLDECIQDTELTGHDLRTTHLTVLCINRYVLDPDFIKQTNGLQQNTCTGNSDAYDITVADDVNRRKLVLVSKLNHLVQQNKLYCGCTVRLTKCRVRFDETDLQSDCIVVVEDLVITGSNNDDDVGDCYDYPWYPSSNVKQTQNVPLLSSRGCYVNVWTTSDIVIPDNIQTGQSAQDVDTSDMSQLDLCCVKELATRWGRIQTTKPPVLVRVVRKCRLLHYAKPDKADKWPFQQLYLVCDKSGFCTLVLWNVLCLKYLKQIKEGTVLMLRNFTVKKSFHVNYQWHIHNNDLDLYPIDINLNAHHPAGEITIMNNRSLPRQIRLPELKHRFVTRHKLSSLPDDVICDVAGMVVYVGRVEREAVKGKHASDSGGFWLRRWIELRDHTHEKPFIIEIYRGQDPVFDSLKPYQVVMCRHMRVRHNLGSLQSSRDVRHVFLTSTPLSQYVTMQQALSPTVRAWMINVSRQLSDVDGQQDTSVGGHYSYPPLPTSMGDFKQLMPNITISPCSSWRHIIDSLRHRQHMRLYVQAKLAALKFHGADRRQNQGRLKKKMKAEPLEAVVNTKTHENIEQFDSVAYQDAMESNLLPHLYSRGDKLNRLNLPSTDEPQSDLNGRNSSHAEDVIVMTWQGLNSLVLLHTVKSTMDVVLPRLPNFEDFVSGRYDDDMEDDEEAVSLQYVKSLLESATKFADKRFLLVLDVLRDSDTHVEVVLNRGFVIGS